MERTEVPATRLTDADRARGERLLAEHLDAGSLTTDECAERSARARGAATRRELLELFADLPEPRPRFDLPAPGGPGSDPRWQRHLRAGALAIGVPSALFGIVAGLVVAVEHPIALGVAAVVVGAVYLGVLSSS